MTYPSSYCTFLYAAIVIIGANNAAIPVSLPFSDCLRVLVPRVCVARFALATWSSLTRHSYLLDNKAGRYSRLCSILKKRSRLPLLIILLKSPFLHSVESSVINFRRPITHFRSFLSMCPSSTKVLSPSSPSLGQSRHALSARTRVLSFYMSLHVCLSCKNFLAYIAWDPFPGSFS